MLHIWTWRRKKRLVQKIKIINFVKAGKMGKATQTTSGILATANDWNMHANVNQKLKCPPEIAITNQRPDIVLWSNNTRQAVLIELTVP
jgi:glycerol kinase